MAAIVPHLVRFGAAQPARPASLLDPARAGAKLRGSHHQARRMSVCHASSIVCDAGTVSWFGPAGSTWSVPAAQVLAVAEYTSEDPEGWCVAFVIDASGAWMQAPANANGMSVVLKDLGRMLNARLELQLGTAKPGSSRVMFPQRCETTPLFAGAARRSLHPQLLAAIAGGR